MLGGVGQFDRNCKPEDCIKPHRFSMAGFLWLYAFSNAKYIVWISVRIQMTQTTTIRHLVWCSVSPIYYLVLVLFHWIKFEHRMQKTWKKTARHSTQRVNGFVNLLLLLKLTTKYISNYILQYMKSINWIMKS